VLAEVAFQIHDQSDVYVVKIFSSNTKTFISQKNIVWLCSQNYKPCSCYRNEIKSHWTGYRRYETQLLRFCISRRACEKNDTIAPPFTSCDVIVSLFNCLETIVYIRLLIALASSSGTQSF